MPVVTNTAVLEVVGLMLAESAAADASSKTAIDAVMRFIGGLKRNPVLKPYWQGTDAEMLSVHLFRDLCPSHCCSHLAIYCMACAKTCVHGQGLARFGKGIVG